MWQSTGGDNGGDDKVESRMYIKNNDGGKNENETRDDIEPPTERVDVGERPANEERDDVDTFVGSSSSRDKKIKEEDSSSARRAVDDVLVKESRAGEMEAQRRMNARAWSTFFAGLMSGACLVLIGASFHAAQIRSSFNMPAAKVTPAPNLYSRVAEHSANSDADRLNEALNFYNVESSGLLKRSMLHAGFTANETIEIDGSYLNFARRALLAELTRIEKIRKQVNTASSNVKKVDDVTKSAADVGKEAQTCSAEDANCKDTTTSSEAKESTSSKVEKEVIEKNEPKSTASSTKLKKIEKPAAAKKVERVRVKDSSTKTTAEPSTQKAEQSPAVEDSSDDSSDDLIDSSDDDSSDDDDDDTPGQLEDHFEKEKAGDTSNHGKFLLPELKPGQTEILKWEDGSVVQEYGSRVGLPPQLVPEITKYAKEMGLYDIMMNKIYDDPLEPGEVEWYSFQSPYQKGAPESEMRNFTWNAERPASHWRSDAHWFNTADELSHEEMLRVLARGGFDEVLKGLGETYNLDTLQVDSFGFIAVTHCDGGYIHHDFEDVEGKVFDILFEIDAPKDIGPELVLEGTNKKRGAIKYRKDVAWVNGDGTKHGTNMCDLRANRGVRLSATIFLADVTKGNIHIFAKDDTAIFPPMGAQKLWIWATRGRHWLKDGGGNGLTNDEGRIALTVKDSAEGCTMEHCYQKCRKEDCNDSMKKASRNSCLKTCKVFIDMDEYDSGTKRSEWLGY